MVAVTVYCIIPTYYDYCIIIVAFIHDMCLCPRMCNANGEAFYNKKLIIHRGARNEGTWLKL